jgi:uncharacterized protein (TIGR02246 family)
MKGHPMKTLSSLALMLALAAASSCAPRLNDPADVQAIRQLMDGYFKAANAKDSAALDAVLTDKTILLEPHMKALVGKDAIGKMHQAFLAGFDMDAKGPATEVRVAGDLAVAYGAYAETITPKDTTLAAEKATGHWLAVLGRQGDGSWKWDWVIANSDQPLPGMTADGADEQAILEIERGFVTAAKTRDVAFFERALAKEYTQFADGKPVNVAAQLAEIRAGNVQFESLTMRDVRTHVVGDAAIVSMAAESKGTYKGKPFSEKSKGVDFFVKRDGRWQLVSSQATTLKE